MSSKTKSGIVRSSVRQYTAKPPGTRGREASMASDIWQQTVQVLDECDDELDCQRIVQGDGGRSLPLYYDE
jgi:hypothetical protein